jgi:hypothetical protein
MAPLSTGGQQQVDTDAHDLPRIARKIPEVPGIDLCAPSAHQTSI